MSVSCLKPRQHTFLQNPPVLKSRKWCWQLALHYIFTPHCLPKLSDQTQQFLNNSALYSEAPANLLLILISMLWSNQQRNLCPLWNGLWYVVFASVQQIILLFKYTVIDRSSQQDLMLDPWPNPQSSWTKEVKRPKGWGQGSSMPIKISREVSRIKSYTSKKMPQACNPVGQRKTRGILHWF